MVVGQFGAHFKKMKKKRTYITEVIKKEEVKYEGPEISASSWEDAEKQGAILVGELA